MLAPPIVRFSPRDLARFSDASFDRNPLHLSEEYARKTAYGERVVFGVLGLLAALGRTSERSGWQLVRLSADFQGPLFLDVNYTVELSQDSLERVVGSVLDGRELVMSFSASFEPGTPALAVGGGVVPPGETPALFKSASIADATADGHYYPTAGFQALVDEFGLGRRGLSTMQIAALLWSSYLVGMQLPGERALFSRLVLKFAQPPPDAGAPLTYQARVAAFDERFNLARITAQLSVAEVPFAEVELRAFVRDDLPSDGRAELTRLLPASNKLDGHVALVTGGSRGLGAAIVRALASQGCTVLANYLRSRAEVECLSADATPGRVVALQGDAADPTWAASTRQMIATDYGRLDVLVCNAALALRPMSLQPNYAARLAEYVAQSVALASTPIATFIEQLAEGSGWNVVISSAAVDSPPAEWPHYVSAKSAVEALTRVAALQQPNVGYLIVRPPRLLTDLTNTPAPLSRAGTLAPEVIAARIVMRLLEPAERGRVEVLDSFS